MLGNFWINGYIYNFDIREAPKTQNASRIGATGMSNHGIGTEIE